MSLFDYLASREIGGSDQPFYALIMAAMRQADSHNLELLKRAFPFTWRELDARYNAPGGVLPSDPEGERQALAMSAIRSGVAPETARLIASLPEGWTPEPTEEG